MFDILITDEYDNEIEYITINDIEDLEEVKTYSNKGCALWIVDFDDDGKVSYGYDVIVKFAECFENNDNRLIYALKEEKQFNAEEIIESINQYELWTDVRTLKDYGYYLAEDMLSTNPVLLPYIDLERFASDNISDSDKDLTQYGLLVYIG